MLTIHRSLVRRAAAVSLLILSLSSRVDAAAAPPNGLVYATVGALHFIVDMGEENDVEANRAAHFQRVNGRSDLVRLAPLFGRQVFASVVSRKYLLHFWLDPHVDGVLGSDFLSRPLWVNFAHGRLEQTPPARIVAEVPLRSIAIPEPRDRQVLTESIFPIRIGTMPVRCSLDTGTAGRFSARVLQHLPGPALRAVNVLAPRLFDALRSSKSVRVYDDAARTWTFVRNPDASSGPATESVQALIVPIVRVGSIQLHNVVFVRRPEATPFPRLSRLFKVPVLAQCGGALLSGYTVRTDFQKRRLQIGTTP